ncbi:rhodanese-like domain-containing protein, partial [Pelagibacteraceae bacterium]|nr:rhodanese-like domain-containing protein [Pelagibacteraceae bacterium]
KIELKINKIDFLPFNKLRVRLKKEIVSLGKGKFENSKFKGSFIEPEKWNNFVSRKDIKLIDTRNIYEIGIGKFKNSINPQTNTFREFPSKLSNLGITKKDKLAIYCTGGIRCEKASAYLKQNGYQNVSQLKGGILNYLDYFNKNK